MSHEHLTAAAGKDSFLHNLSPTMKAFAEELAMLSSLAMTSIGPWFARLSLLVGPLQQANLQGDGDPDGYADLARKGPYERLLGSEWGVLLEFPDEFIRRVVMQEHVFLQLARESPAGEICIAVLFDAGPSQLGAPRLAHVALLAVLHERARRMQARLLWATLQDPSKIHEGFHDKNLKEFLQKRTIATIDGDGSALSAFLEAIETYENSENSENSEKNKKTSNHVYLHPIVVGGAVCRGEIQNYQSNNTTDNLDNREKTPPTVHKIVHKIVHKKTYKKAAPLLLTVDEKIPGYGIAWDAPRELHVTLISEQRAPASLFLPLPDEQTCYQILSNLVRTVVVNHAPKKNRALFGKITSSLIFSNNGRRLLFAQYTNDKNHQQGMTLIAYDTFAGENDAENHKSLPLPPHQIPIAACYMWKRIVALTTDGEKLYAHNVRQGFSMPIPVDFVWGEHGAGLLHPLAGVNLNNNKKIFYVTDANHRLFVVDPVQNQISSLNAKAICLDRFSHFVSYLEYDEMTDEKKDKKSQQRATLRAHMDHDVMRPVCVLHATHEAAQNAVINQYNRASPPILSMLEDVDGKWISEARIAAHIFRCGDDEEVLGIIVDASIHEARVVTMAKNRLSFRLYVTNIGDKKQNLLETINTTKAIYLATVSANSAQWAALLDDGTVWLWQSFRHGTTATCIISAGQSV